ncbi:MAG TPA: RNA polymerase subunit sigma [Xanthomonadaceae bacterium]|nr:RNA polymerase subunit sigma [Xanthomonadaceae bacterium]
MFHTYYRELLNFLTRKVRDRETAADLAQESYARVYAAEQSGVVIHNPRALLYRTARNLVVDNFRRGVVRDQGRKPEPDEPSIDPDDQAGPEAFEPEVAQAARQRFEAVVSIVEALPPRCREAFLYVKFDGLTHADVAQRMGIAVKTVEMHIRVALAACWDHLETLDEVTRPPQARRGGAARTGQTVQPAAFPKDAETDSRLSEGNPT